MKATIKGFIYARGTRHFNVETSKMVDGPEYSFYTSDNLHESEHFRDYALVSPHEIIADVPDSFDPRQQIVKNLEAEKRRLKAEFGKRVTEIDRQIQTYMAIENKPTEAA